MYNIRNGCHGDACSQGNCSHNLIVLSSWLKLYDKKLNIAFKVYLLQMVVIVITKGCHGYEKTSDHSHSNSIILYNITRLPQLWNYVTGHHGSTI